MNGIIMGALSGAGNALQSIGANAQKTMDQQDLLKTQSDLALQKDKAIADYQNQLGLTTQANERARVQGELQNNGSDPTKLLASTGDVGTASVLQSMSAKEAEANAKLLQANTAADRAKAQGELNEANAARVKAEQAAYGKEVTKDAFGNPILIDKSNGQVTPLGGTSTTTANGSGLTGDDFLKTLSPQIAGQVKAIAEGRQALPSGFAMKSPMGAQLLAAVSQYDPSFDVANVGARSATRKDFTSGKAAENVTALNTAIAHLDRLSQNFDKLNNGNFGFLNSAENWVGSTAHIGSTQGDLARVSADTEAVSHELAKVFRSTGMSEGEIKAWQTKINPNLPPDAQKAVIGEALDLMNGRLEALSDRYNKGMGTTKQPLELLTPKSQQALNRLLTKAGETPNPTENTQPQTNAPANIPTVNAQGWTLHVDAQGNQAYVSPDGKSYQEVQ